MTITKILRFAAFAAALSAVAACNTIEGVGKDTKSVGKAIERTADDAKD